MELTLLIWCYLYCLVFVCILQLILISTGGGEIPNKVPPPPPPPTKSLSDIGASDETVSNSEESDSDSKGFPVKPVDSEIATNLKDLKELKTEVKPKVTLSSEVAAAAAVSPGTDAAAAVSPGGDNHVSVRRSTRVFSGGKGSPFQLVSLLIISKLTQTLMLGKIIIILCIL